MYNQRYGKTRFSDFMDIWIALGVFLMFEILSLVVDVYPYAFLIFILWELFSAYYCIRKSKEQFLIESDKIILKAWGKTTEIPLPDTFLAIISLADLRPPATCRTDIGGKTLLLKNRIAISILRPMDIDHVLETLHSLPRLYTNTDVEDYFWEWRFLFYFVTDQELLTSFLHNRNCTLVIPKSLSEQISVTEEGVTVVIDERF